MQLQLQSTGWMGERMFVLGEEEEQQERGGAVT